MRETQTQVYQRVKDHTNKDLFDGFLYFHEVMVDNFQFTNGQRYEMSQLDQELSY